MDSEYTPYKAALVIATIVTFIIIIALTAYFAGIETLNIANEASDAQENVIDTGRALCKTVVGTNINSVTAFLPLPRDSLDEARSVCRRFLETNS